MTRSHSALSATTEPALRLTASRPRRWPPPKDFPILARADGTVVSRYSDTVWNFSPWTGTSCSINFGDDVENKRSPRLDRANAYLLRQLVAWWLCFPQHKFGPKTIVRYFAAVRPFFVLCSEHGIESSDLYRFSTLQNELPSRVGASELDFLLNILHTIYENHKEIGFHLLTPYQIAKLKASFPDHLRRQTPYIPPRIWRYQIMRLEEALNDFLEKSHSICECYKYCAEMSNSKPKSGYRSISRLPNNKLGSFDSIAEHFSIKSLLFKWGFKCIDRIPTLTKYCTFVHRVAIAYILNFSMMRISEAWSLKKGCLQCKEDASLGNIYSLVGRTTKTVKESDTHWIVPASVEIAIKTLELLSSLRAPHSITGVDSVSPDYLSRHIDDPWTRSWNGRRTNLPTYPSYVTVIREFPGLLDKDQLRITQADLEAALLVTPSLNNDVYRVGEIWLLSWHQLRRTGAVNMQASGLVSDAALQYQLKHATRFMSLYYAQGFAFAGLNQSVKAEFIRTMYEVLAIHINSALTTPERYVSPYGEERRREIMTLVSESDHQKLSAAARAGEVSWRSTLVGACTKRGPCPFGGIDNVIRCGGGDGRQPCADALYDAERVDQIQELGSLLESRLAQAESGSAYAESLSAQLYAVKNVLGALQLSDQHTAENGKR